MGVSSTNVVAGDGATSHAHPASRPSAGRTLPSRLSFVLCPSFHGATLLSLLLNNHSSISALGDTNPTREYDQVCACRERVSACVFWQTVAERLDADRFSHLGTFLPNLPWPLTNHHLEGSHMGISSRPAVNRAAGGFAAAVADMTLPLLWARRTGAVSEYLDVWESFYGLVRELHGTSLVVDGSKSSRKVAFMARHLDDSAHVRVIHLVRDPRGFVASTVRYNEGASLRTSSWLWSDLHRRMEGLQSRVPYLRVRYEDLAQHPEEQMTAIMRFLDVSYEPVLAAPKFPQKHHLMGNSMLFKFDGEVKFDERWRTTLPLDAQAKVLEYAGETAARYGYA